MDPGPASLQAVLARAALLGLLAWSGAAWARSPFQLRCEEAAATARAGFFSRDAGYRIDNSLSTRSLTALKRPGVAGGMVLGLTRTETRVGVRIDGLLLEDPTGRWECVAPQVDVTLSYPPMTVFIGSEFVPGSCAYGEILAHEMRHLQSYLAWLPRAVARIRARMAPRYAGKPFYAPRGQARAMLQQDIDSNWMPYIKSEMMRIEAAQAAIDSPREYDRLSKVCRGEVQSLIGPARGSRS